MKSTKEIHALAFKFMLKHFEKFHDPSVFSYVEGYEVCQKEYEEKLRWIPLGEKMPDKGDKSQFIVKGIYGAIQTRNDYCLMLTLDPFYSEPQFRHYPHFIPTHWRSL